MPHREPAADQEILTVEQAAGYLQVHRLTIYRYIRQGLLPAARLGKMYRLFRRDVEAFLDSMKQHPVPPAAEASPKASQPPPARRPRTMASRPHSKGRNLEAPAEE
jgi:excisionase family DNA binding protein